MRILLRESKEFGNFKSGKYLRGGKWIPAVAYNEEEGWVIVRITAKEYAEDMYCDSVEELMSDYGYDAGTPKYIYLGYDLERSTYDDGEGESAVVGIEWEDRSYAYYGERNDNDHTTFDNMVKAIVVNGLDLSLGDYSAKRTLPEDKKAVKTESFDAFETYSINDIIEARERVDAAWDWDELTDEAVANDDYALIAVAELDAIKRFLSISDADVKDLSKNESGDYLRLRLRSGETRYFFERGDQLKDKDTGKLIPIHL